jgi:hypothetical protein
MTKAELLADIEAKSLKVVAVAEEVDSVKNTAGVRSYMANVMEQNGDSVQGRNIGFYTIEEGLPAEVAYYRDVVAIKKDIRTKVENYLEGLRPATILSYAIISVDEVQKVARARIVTLADLTEREVIVYKVGTNWTHGAIIKA